MASRRVERLGSIGYTLPQLIGTANQLMEKASLYTLSKFVAAAGTENGLVHVAPLESKEHHEVFRGHSGP